MAQFKLGKLVMTRSIAAQIEESSDFSAYIWQCLRRYVRCDWGNKSEHDRRANDSAVANNDERIFASYKDEAHSDWHIWIITEADRSYTTVLFPSDY